MITHVPHPAFDVDFETCKIFHWWRGRQLTDQQIYTVDLFSVVMGQKVKTIVG
jgi:hypothetical protein